MMARHESLDYWLALTLVPGLGALGIARAWRSLGSVEAIFAVPAATLVAFGMRTAAASAILAFSAWPQVASLRHRVREIGGEIISLDNPLYPENLAQISDPPPILFLKGDLSALRLPAIAVVGARRASELGRRFAFSLSSRLAAQGLAVISGLALGVDGAAHEGSLRGGGPTIAVLGTGLDVVYPAAHRHLSEKIIENGVLLTEFPPGAGPDKHHFPRRNRLVSGLAQGVVVVEAGEKSGSLITARLALEQGREVFAVPGPPGLPGSRGVNRLLKDGAQLLESVEDIFSALPWLSSASTSGALAAARTRRLSKRPALSSEQACLVAALGPDEMTFDALLEKLAWENGLLSRVLLELELSGMLLKGIGNSFRLAPEYIGEDSVV
ncbi:MAG: DNA-processing protein DprA [Deltaproteobacteria bacterium]|nr:DNA-processing protein DprA [Deltaproteobacteria bacterium]